MVWVVFADARLFADTGERSRLEPRLKRKRLQSENVAT